MCLPAPCGVWLSNEEQLGRGFAVAWLERGLAPNPSRSARRGSTIRQTGERMQLIIGVDRTRRRIRPWRSARPRTSWPARRSEPRGRSRPVVGVGRAVPDTAVGDRGRRRHGLLCWPSSSLPPVSMFSTCRRPSRLGPVCWARVGARRTIPTMRCRWPSPRCGPGTSTGPARRSQRGPSLLAKRNTDIGNQRTRLVFSSGGRTVHRLLPAREPTTQPGAPHGRRLPAWPTPLRRPGHFDRRVAEDKTKKEALRALKRQVSNAVYRQLVADGARARG